MSQKTPFEIRADLLKMAQEHLQQQYFSSVGFANKAWETYLQSFKAEFNYPRGSMLELQEQWMAAMTKFMPAAPSVQDIIAKANELYGFVQKKD